MTRSPKAAGSAGAALLPRVFAASFGAFLGVALLKFGNPIIMEKWVTPPADVYQFLLWCPWPIAWAYWLLALVSVPGLLAARWKPGASWWLPALPLVWLLWQFVAAANSAEPELSHATLKHFVAAAACFYLGFFTLSRLERPTPFWLGLLAGFVLVLANGWEQRFGGLAETRRHFYEELYPKLTEIPPGYLKKLSSDRIFATLFYPNTLAGAILLLLPPLLAVIAQLRAWFTTGARAFLLTVVGLGALACLYWSGSKGGWLLALVLGLIALLRLQFPRQLKVGLVAVVLVAGTAGFFWKYAGFFRQGATSVVARFDYWEAAVQTAKANPLLGTGPGTFGPHYERIKRPESEPARLAHNDYLEQASDSGLPGMLAYGVFIIGALVRVFPSRQPGPAPNQIPAPSLSPVAFAVWLGLLGWALQSLFEFSLYIPALAWPAFALLGWSLGRK